MRSRFYRRIGAYLGLLAILMMTLAPAVSHALAGSGEITHGSHGSACDAQLPHLPRDSAPDTGDISHSSALHWQCCGYCNLAAHLPILPSVESDFAITVWIIQHRVATTFESLRRIEPRTSAQPRAPPTSS